MTEEHVRVPADALRLFCQTVFERAGVPSEAAALVADALIDAELRGVSTHGLVRVPL
jgi:LDH2 family malate/lactate/ureidoglycolate dehydrogenase